MLLSLYTTDGHGICNKIGRDNVEELLMDKRAHEEKRENKYPFTARYGLKRDYFHSG